MKGKAWTRLLTPTAPALNPGVSSLANFNIKVVVMKVGDLGHLKISKAKYQPWSPLSLINFQSNATEATHPKHPKTYFLNKKNEICRLVAVYKTSTPLKLLQFSCLQIGHYNVVMKKCHYPQRQPFSGQGSIPQYHWIPTWQIPMRPNFHWPHCPQGGSAHVLSGALGLVYKWMCFWNGNVSKRLICQANSWCLVGAMAPSSTKLLEGIQDIGSLGQVVAPSYPWTSTQRWE